MSNRQTSYQPSNNRTNDSNLPQIIGILASLAGICSCMIAVLAFFGITQFYDLQDPSPPDSGVIQAPTPEDHYEPELPPQRPSTFTIGLACIGQRSSKTFRAKLPPDRNVTISYTVIEGPSTINFSLSDPDDRYESVDGQYSHQLDFYTESGGTYRITFSQDPMLMLNHEACPQGSPKLINIVTTIEVTVSEGSWSDG